MKKALVILFSLFSISCFQAVTIQAGNQLPEWKVKVMEGEDNAEITLTVSNNTLHKMFLEFSTSQYYDYIVADQSGKEIYRYRDNKAFLQAIQRITLNSGGKKVWQDKWNYTTSDGKKSPPGEYTVRALLQAEQINGKPAQEPIDDSVKLTIEEENPSFRKVEMSSSKEIYCVMGQAKVSAGNFYYTVEDGHNILKEETIVKVNKESPNWSNFEFSFELEVDEINKNRPVLINLYERDLEEGTIYNSYTIRIN
ncbi:BsuPI-related putative proteinase inhibitor [Bacillus sp. P14.5]|uniref:BsuPI-related putative proteinase inhibitor n=1 Tax=Bacillus sp. P14.5 TaxID=1983400 RepID=UPI000DE954BF|nr:BsuPI-related putative proteinase inhibitor [Bacillus sp. P14.5]